MKRIFLFHLLFALVQPFFAQLDIYNLLIGTYTNTGKSEGIYSYNVDLKNGIFTKKSVATGVSNPSYIAISDEKKFVYSVNESSNASAVSAFSFDILSGKLQLINTTLTKGAGPCYVSVTRNHVFTANYSGGSISVFGRKANGSITETLQFIQHVGKRINPTRQSVPHVHQVILTPDRKYLVANDLGTDKVTVYRYNSQSINEILVPHDSITVKPGSGPRHVTFSRDGKRLYLLQEMDGTISVLEMKEGKLRLLQETSVVRKEGMENGAADIHLSPDEKFLYATNRGNVNDISCFEVEKNGKLIFKQKVSTGGIGPRNFTITPDGKYILIANQRSDNIVVFKRDKITSILADTGKRIEVGAPVCLVIY